MTGGAGMIFSANRVSSPPRTAPELSNVAKRPWSEQRRCLDAAMDVIHKRNGFPAVDQVDIQAVRPSGDIRELRLQSRRPSDALLKRLSFQF